jgi:hypothetical protein
VDNLWLPAARWECFRQLRLHLQLFERCPGQLEASVVDVKEVVVAADLQVDAFPRRPVALRHPPPIKVFVRLAWRARKHMQKRLTFVEFVVGGAHGEPCHLAQLLQIVDDGTLQVVGRHVVLVDLVLELAEELRLVVPELRLKPVFGIEEDLTRGFPDAEILHPFPCIPVGSLSRRNLDLRLEPHQASLDEQLDCAVRLHDPAARHARAHLGIDQVIGKDIIRRAKPAVRANQVADQGIALAGANTILTGLDRRLPRGVLKSLLDQLAQLGGTCLARLARVEHPRDLVERESGSTQRVDCGAEVTVVARKEERSAPGSKRDRWPGLAVLAGLHGEQLR